MLITASFLVGCATPITSSDQANEIFDIYDDAFLKLLDVSQDFDVLGGGFGWSEGPAWDRNLNKLYFTDVPGNVAYQWSESTGVEEFLNPSGSSVTEGFREPGANGLLFTHNRNLLICNHGERAVQRMDLATKERENLAQTYQGKKFNSPNDVIVDDSENIYFTDPPYGLEGLDQSPLKQLDFNGVFRLNKTGGVEPLIKDMTFPNGVALSADQRTLYITQSDPEAPHLYALDLARPGSKKSLLVDFSSYMKDGSPGLPDGMVVDQMGNIFVTGPGGVFVISPRGKVLGRINTGKGSANCTFGGDGSILFITNHDRLIKLKTKTRGLAWKS